MSLLNRTINGHIVHFFRESHNRYIVYIEKEKFHQLFTKNQRDTYSMLNAVLDFAQSVKKQNATLDGNVINVKVTFRWFELVNCNRVWDLWIIRDSENQIIIDDTFIRYTIISPYKVKITVDTQELQRGWYDNRVYMLEIVHNWLWMKYHPYNHVNPRINLVYFDAGFITPLYLTETHKLIAKAPKVLEFEYNSDVTGKGKLVPLGETKDFVEYVEEKKYLHYKIKGGLKEYKQRLARQNEWVVNYIKNHNIDTLHIKIDDAEVYRIFESDTNLIEFTMKVKNQNVLNSPEYYYAGVTPERRFWAYQITPVMALWKRESILKRLINVSDLSDFVEQ